MQQDVHNTVEAAAIDGGADPAALMALAERVATWATRDMHDDDSAKLRSRTYALAGALADWAEALSPEKHEG